MTEKLTVSVAMCSYNGGPYLEEQLESIRAQTFQPCELVVNDDGSTDQTVEILKRFRERAPFPVRIEENPKNLGPTKNFERSMGRCTGDIIVISDCDDIFPPRKLELVRSALMANEDIGCVFGDAALIRSDGADMNLSLWESIGFADEDQRRFERGDIVDALFRRTIAFGGVMGFRREVLDVALPIPLPWGHDNWTALIASALFGVALIREPLLYYRTHSAQYSGSARASVFKKLTMAARPHSQADKSWVPKARSFGFLLDRLREHEGKARSRKRFEEILKHTAAKHEHMRVREELPASLFERVPPVFREARTRRYHHYSNGASSIVRDVVFGGP